MREWIATTALKLFDVLLPYCWIVLAILLLIILPLSIIKKARKVTGPIMYVSSYLFGLVTWLLGAAITFSSLGIIWLIIGIVILGIGVVPIGIIGGFFIYKSAAIGLVILILLCNYSNLSFCWNVGD